MKRLNITDGASPEFCCGAMAPRQEIQARIDSMQSLINRMYMYYHMNEPDNVVKLKEELVRLQTI